MAIGTPFIRNKCVTCFSIEEEKESGWINYIPLKLEEKLKELGAAVHNKRPFEENVVNEGNYLISAQNLESVKKWTETLVKLTKQHELL